MQQNVPLVLSKDSHWVLKSLGLNEALSHLDFCGLLFLPLAAVLCYFVIGTLTYFPSKFSLWNGLLPKKIEDASRS